MNCGSCKHQYDTSNHVPKILIGCGHSLCFNCLEAQSEFYSKEKEKDLSLECPFCQKISNVTSISSLPTNLSMLENIPNLDSQDQKSPKQLNKHFSPSQDNKKSIDASDHFNNALSSKKLVPMNIISSQQGDQHDNDTESKESSEQDQSVDNEENEENKLEGTEGESIDENEQQINAEEECEDEEEVTITDTEITQQQGEQGESPINDNIQSKVIEDNQSLDQGECLNMQEDFRDQFSEFSETQVASEQQFSEQCLCQHHFKEIQGFCESCKSLICLDCIFKNHKSHAIYNLMEATQRQNSKLFSKQRHYYELQEKVQRKIDSLKFNIEDIKQTYAIQESKIDETYLKIQKAVNQRKFNLIQNLEQNQETKLRNTQLSIQGFQQELVGIQILLQNLNSFEQLQPIDLLEKFDEINTKEMQFEDIKQPFKMNQLKMSSLNVGVDEEIKQIALDLHFPNNRGGSRQPKRGNNNTPSNNSNTGNQGNPPGPPIKASSFINSFIKQQNTSEFPRPPLNHQDSNESKRNKVASHTLPNFYKRDNSNSQMSKNLQNSSPIQHKPVIASKDAAQLRQRPDIQTSNKFQKIQQKLDESSFNYIQQDPDQLQKQFMMQRSDQPSRIAGQPVSVTYEQALGQNKVNNQSSEAQMESNQRIQSSFNIQFLNHERISSASSSQISNSKTLRKQESKISKPSKQDQSFQRQSKINNSQLKSATNMNQGLPSKKSKGLNPSTTSISNFANSVSYFSSNISQSEDNPEKPKKKKIKKSSIFNPLKTDRKAPSSKQIIFHNKQTQNVTIIRDVPNQDEEQTYYRSLNLPQSTRLLYWGKEASILLSKQLRILNHYSFKIQKLKTKFAYYPWKHLRDYSVAVFQHQLYIAGGISQDDSVQDKVCTINLVSGESLELFPMSKPKFGSKMIMVPAISCIYLIGGYLKNQRECLEIEKLDLKKNKWSLVLQDDQLQGVTSQSQEYDSGVVLIPEENKIIILNQKIGEINLVFDIQTEKLSQITSVLSSHKNNSDIFYYNQLNKIVKNYEFKSLREQVINQIPSTAFKKNKEQTTENQCNEESLIIDNFDIQGAGIQDKNQVTKTPNKFYLLKQKLEPEVFTKNKIPVTSEVVSFQEADGLYPMIFSSQ